MATKKQKREQALAKHEEFMARYRRDGLEAQRKDREIQAEKEVRVSNKIKEIDHQYFPNAVDVLSVLLVKSVQRQNSSEGQ